MSEKMTLRGFDWDFSNSGLQQNPSDLQYEQPFSTGNSTKHHHGMPITAQAAYQIVELFFRKVTCREPATSPLKEILWVEFSKASLFRILSQPACEHVRFYFGIPDDGVNEASLVLEGLTARGNPVRGKGILNNIGVPPPGSTTAPTIDTTDFGQYEEKGNGGGTTPPTPGLNIYSMSQLIAAWKDKRELAGTFQEFMTEAFTPFVEESFL